MAKGKISDLKFDDRNANKHSEYGMQRLEKGLRKNGLGRSILISSDNKIIAGNGVTETAGAIGIEDVRIVETDGTEIIAVKRTDIKSGTKEFYEMALSDNIIAKDNIVMDAEVTNAICEEYEIEDYKIEYVPTENEDEQQEATGLMMNIQFDNEHHLQEWYERLIGEGLNCKIV